jgi:hypothetical protein
MRTVNPPDGLTLRERMPAGALPASLYAFVAAVLLTAACAWPPAANAKSLSTGITDPIESYAAPSLFFERIRQADASMVRLTISWREAAPTTRPDSWDPTDPADPHYYWDTADAEITRAVAAGLVPVVAVTDVPAWAQGCSAQSAYNPCDPEVRAFADFARAFARRFSGKFGGLPQVTHWQALNEPNSALYFNPQYRDGRLVSPELYRRLLNAFAAAVKSVDPANVVIAAGLAPLQLPGYTVGPLDFARRLLCMKGRRRPAVIRSGCEEPARFDVLAINPYTTGGPTHKAPGADDVVLGDLGKLRTLLDAADRAGRIDGLFPSTPLWITEFGWDSRPPDPGGLPMRTAARWMCEALYRAWRAKVEVFFWFGLRDQESGGSFPTSVQSGLYFRGPTLDQDRPKQRLLQAFSFPFVALRRKRSINVWGRVPANRGGRIKIELWAGKRWRLVATVPAGRTGVFHKVVGGRFGRRALMRAQYRKLRSVPFSLQYVEDFYQPPFG